MSEMENSQVRISCQNVWKIFGPNSQRTLSGINDGMTKDEVLEQTGHVIAVKDVSFDIHEGEAFVIMGLSGSGKSTLVRCINGLIQPTQGRVLIDGVGLDAMDETELRMTRRHKIAMVFQHFALLPHRNVIDNVAYGLEIQDVEKAQRHQKALEMLDLVGLHGWNNNYPGELSGGMQQRVGLARALAVDPEVLLMDEPFSALDPLIRRQMQDEFINLMSAVHKTIVFITHDLNEALKLGERIAIMKDGEVVQLGSPEEIVASPTDDYVAEFVRDVPRSKVIPVKNVMREPELILYPWQGPKVALHAMKEKDITSAFVVDSWSRLKGIIMLDEVTRAIARDITRLDEVTREDSLQIGPDQPIEELIPLTAASDRPVAVVDENGRLVGEVPRVALLLGMAGEENGNGAT